MKPFTLIGLVCLFVAFPLSARTEIVTSASDREEIDITIYSSGDGVVRETRRVRLPKGTVVLSVLDLPSHVNPDTMLLQPRRPRDGFQVLGREYAYALFTPSALMDAFLGKMVLVRRPTDDGESELAEARLLHYREGILLETHDQVFVGKEDWLSFPGKAPGLPLRPQFLWELESAGGEQLTELLYLTGGLRWDADYTLIIESDEEQAHFTGWATITNESGVRYPDAHVSWVAGAVQRAGARRRAFDLQAEGALALAQEPVVTTEPFFEYHRYEVEKPLTLEQKTKRQLQLFQREAVEVEKKLLFYGAQYAYRRPFNQQKSPAQVFFSTTNSESNQLGFPLAQGIVRLYLETADGKRDLIGEDRIGNTPSGEEVRLRAGSAFDVIGERKQAEFERLGAVYESAWEITIENKKEKKRVSVEVIEPLPASWEIVESSHDFEKLDATTIRFRIAIAPQGTERISYRIRVQERR